MQAVDAWLDDEIGRFGHCHRQCAAYNRVMTKRRSKRLRDSDKILRLQENARARYVYFIQSDIEGLTGYWWELVGPNDETICSSAVFHSKADCLKALRVTQRHAATTAVRDDP